MVSCPNSAMNFHFLSLEIASYLLMKVTFCSENAFIYLFSVLKVSIFTYLEIISTWLGLMYVPINRITPSSSIVKVVEWLYALLITYRYVFPLSVTIFPLVIFRYWQLPLKVSDMYFPFSTYLSVVELKFSMERVHPFVSSFIRKVPNVLTIVSLVVNCLKPTELSLNYLRACAKAIRKIAQKNFFILKSICKYIKFTTKIQYNFILAARNRPCFIRFLSLFIPQLFQNTVQNI